MEDCHSFFPYVQQTRVNETLSALPSFSNTSTQLKRDNILSLLKYVPLNLEKITLVPQLSSKKMFHL